MDNECVMQVYSTGDAMKPPFAGSPIGSGQVCDVQLEIFARGLQLHRAVASEPELLEQFARGVIVQRGNGDNPAESQDAASVRHDGGGGLECIPVAPEAREKRKTEVHVVQRFARDDATNTDGLARTLQFDQVQSEAQALIHRHRSIDDVAFRGLKRSHTLVPDVLQPRRIVEKFEDEGRIPGLKAANTQPLGFYDIQWRAVE